MNTVGMRMLRPFAATARTRAGGVRPQSCGQAHTRTVRVARRPCREVPPLVVCRTAEEGASESSEGESKERDWVGFQASLINTEQKKEKARVKKLMNRKRRFLPFEDAREWARALCFKSQDDWEDMVIDGRKNSYIPADPSEAYAEDGWESWDDWLGVVHFVEFEEARAYVRGLNLESATQWYEYIREGKLPENIPERPMQIYDQWVDFPDWLQGSE